MPPDPPGLAALSATTFLSRVRTPLKSCAAARIPFTDKWHPFHIPSLELCIPFNCCKCTFLYIWMNRKTRKRSRLFHCHGILPKPLTSLYFTDQNPIFPYLFIYLKPDLVYLFWAEPPRGSTPREVKFSWFVLFWALQIPWLSMTFSMTFLRFSRP